MSQLMEGSPLKSNQNLYRFLTTQVLEDCRFQPETALRLIQIIALFAHGHHTGRFADGAIENTALRLGLELETHCPQADLPYFGTTPAADHRRVARRIMHVATTVMEIGGHTRTILNWVANDPESSHSLLLIDQTYPKIPEWLAAPLLASGGSLTVLPVRAPLLTKARWTRDLVRSRADLVVLHHSGSDIVPTVAFACRDCPPITVVNHADHLFWLGSTVADLVINLRSIGTRLSEERRFVRRNSTLPIPLAVPDTAISHNAARCRLGIPADQTVLLSVGRAEKYRPNGPHDFFATAHKILERQPDARLYLVGVTETEAKRFGGDLIHPRLHPVGPIEDPSDYRRAADIYLEGFPFGSQTALLEAGLSGIPVVPAFAPSLPLVVASDDAIDDLVTNPRHEDAYIARVIRLIVDTQKRKSLGLALRDRMLDHHTGEGWRRRLEELYQDALSLKHEPHYIPTSKGVCSETDIALSNWQAAMEEHAPSAGMLAATMRETLFDLAHWAREAGDYRGAFDLLVRCCRYWRGDRRFLLFLAKLPPHWAVRSRRLGRAIAVNP